MTRYRTVFFIWQSDVTQSRSRIESTLKKVTRDLSDEDFIVGLDKDTAGIPGSPTIDHVVLDKIARADAVVADLTLVGHTPEEDKQLPNPNVLFETGFAFGTVGRHKVILVRDLKYGVAGTVPFDLRQRRLIEFNEPKELRPRLQAAIDSILRAEAPLPGDRHERAHIVRLIRDKSPTRRKALGAEFALLADRTDDRWARLSRYLLTPSPSGWKDEWTYGRKPEEYLFQDVETLLVQSSTAAARSLATTRVDFYLDAVDEHKDIQAFLSQPRKWAPQKGFASGGTYRSNANLAEGQEWLREIEKFGIETAEAQEALGLLAKDKTNEATRRWGTTVESLATRLRARTPGVEYSKRNITDSP